MRVLSQDPAFVAVAKPAGWLVHRTSEAPDDEALLARVRDAIGARVYPVHRLDRGTSGVLVFALDPGAARALHEQLEDGRAQKAYVALVRGALAGPAELLVDHPIPRREGGERVPARTRVAPLADVLVTPGPDGARPQRYGLVAAFPETGRFHQVRRHLKHLGHPVLGDANYGRGEHNRFVRERFGLERLALHAAGLAFDHPTTGARVRLAAPLPEDLAGPLARLGFELATIPLPVAR